MVPSPSQQQTLLCDLICSFLLVFVLFSSSPWVSCCLQVQVIKHRPRQIQKAYPGLLEPGYSYSRVASASNRTQKTNLYYTNRTGVNSAAASSSSSAVTSFSHTVRRLLRRALKSLFNALCDICLPGDTVTAHLSLALNSGRSM